MAPEVWFVNLGIKIKHLHRVAFSLFGIDIYWYGIIISLGIFLGFLITIKEAKRTGQNPELYSDYLIYGIFSSIVFARAYYVVFSWDYYKYHLNEIFSIRNGGIAIYGAIIGCILSAIFYTRIKKISFFKFADTYTFGVLIGQILGRWGNFINREAFGRYTDSLFAMRYIKDQVSSIHESVLDNVINVDGVEYIQVHPTFLYESIWNFFLFLILYTYRYHKKFDGEIMALYFVGYGIGRFWIEGIRTDSLMIGNTNFAISQVLSVVLCLSFFIFIILRRRQLKTKFNNI